MVQSRKFVPRSQQICVCAQIERPCCATFCGFCAGHVRLRRANWRAGRGDDGARASQTAAAQLALQGHTRGAYVHLVTTLTWNVYWKELDVHHSLQTNIRNSQGESGMDPEGTQNAASGTPLLLHTHTDNTHTHAHTHTHTHTLIRNSKPDPHNSFKRWSLVLVPTFEFYREQRRWIRCGV